MFQIEMLPAREGDCLLLTYGKEGHEHRVLVDGGRTATYTDLKAKLDTLPKSQRELELLVVTHVDRDHIEGVIAMLEDPARPVRFRDLWFNGYDHLNNVKVETFGALQGERLTTAILEQRLPWNRSFGGKAIETSPGLNPIELDGGLKLTVVSPNRRKLEALIPQWEAECRKEGLIPGMVATPPETPMGFESFGPIKIDELAEEQFKVDPSKPNGSSIALLAEFEGKRVLLAADAHADLMVSSLTNLAASDGGRLRLDAMKVSHHGSSRNTSKEVLDLISCSTYLISTNGLIHNHPDKSAIARLIQFGGTDNELVFNYKSDENAIWNNKGWEKKHKYRTRYPMERENGSAVITL